MQTDKHVASLIDALTRAAATVKSDDLPELAKMHGWCEALMAATGSSAATPAAPLFEAAKGLLTILAALILGEAGDEKAALAQVAYGVAALAELGAATETPEAGECPAEDDGDVATALNRVFDEEPAAGLAKPATAGEDGDDTGGRPAVAAEGRVPAAGSPDPRPVPAAAAYQSEPLRIGPNELEFVRGFIPEANEHMEAIEAALLEVERAPDDTEQINALFRPFHTIKGAAGFLSLHDINSLTHEVETVLDQARKGKRQVTPALIDLVFDVVDILKVQVSAIAAWLADPKGDVVPQPPVAEMIEHLRRIVAGAAEPESRNQATAGAPPKLGETLVERGVCPQAVVDFALERQKSDAGNRKTGEILVDLGAATTRQVGQALRTQSVPAAASAPPARAASVADLSVRIDTAKLDALVDMVGELVIAQTQVRSNPIVATDAKLTKDVAQAAKIVRDVQEVAMAMRMVPIGPTFQKMARLVRDVSHKAGKSVELIMSGEETELDKNVIQQISDPLVHMLRNAVDHGVEAPEARRVAGKSETGHVHLSASHQAGNIVIEIRDDGRGMDRKALIAKGIERGLVQPGEELTDQQAYQLIFAPGFSLAAQVTDISGRGVGMDVVRRNIEQLRGRIEIASEPGKGSRFTIRLPLTLAIIDGMIVRVGTERFIFQTITVGQALRPRREHITTVQQKGQLLDVRGRLLPLIQLGPLFGLGERIDPCEAMVVIAQHDGGQVGIVVDELIGQQQVVIKSLGERFEGLRGVSGAAILGDGKVGLILETSGLVAAHNKHLTVQRSNEETSRVVAAARPSTVNRPGVTEARAGLAAPALVAT
ncbi:MAG: chemotaxis protein CheW [Planctomycetes bacterium]|nr:chemotaxis protein CheW [Planctomycetota bacterium]